MRRTNATLTYRRTKNLRAVQLLLGHSKLESTVRYLGIEVDDPMAKLGVEAGLQNPEFTRAASECALGRTREGLPKMEALTQELAAMPYAHSPDVALMRSLTGLCALQSHNRARAKELPGKPDAPSPNNRGLPNSSRPRCANSKPSCAKAEPPA